jgi:hypothetical protein
VSVITFIKVGRLKWVDHTSRTDQQWPTKRKLTAEPEGRRKVWIFKLRWKDVVGYHIKGLGERKLESVASRYSDLLRAGRQRGWNSSPVGGKVFLLFTSSIPAMEPSLLSNMFRGSSVLEVKWPGREDDHSPPSSAKIMNKWIYTSTPLYVFVA